MRAPEEIIKDMRKIVKPCITNYFKRLNYENLGSEDAEEFEEEFDAVLNLAEEAIKMRSCTTLRIDNIDEDKLEALIKAMNDSPLEIWYRKYNITPYAVSAVVATHKAVPIEEIEKAYESILDVAEGGYVDIEEVKVHFCKWLGKEDV